MMNQQIAISGLGGQGVLFITRLLAETALETGRDVISSETHGMAMRGGAVISHLKIGPFSSPLIRAGQADAAVFLAAENLSVHPNIIGPKTKVLVSDDNPEPYEGFDAGPVAEAEFGDRRAANLVLLGYGLGRGLFFCNPDQVLGTLERLSKTPAILEANQKALNLGLSRAGQG